MRKLRGQTTLKFFFFSFLLQKVLKIVDIKIDMTIK